MSSSVPNRIKHTLKRLFPSATSFTEEQRYTLDSTGNVIARNVIPQETITKINQLLDGIHNNPATPADDRIDPVSSKFSFMHFDPVFMDLMEHPWIMDACASVLGEGFRFDHSFGKFQNQQTHRDLHGGPFAAQGSCYFQGGLSKEGMIMAGHINFAIPLTPQNAETGGFFYIPGSHRSSYKLVGKEVLKDILHDNFEAECFHYPTLNPGDIMLQPEGSVHGTGIWRGNYGRKFLFFAYSPCFMSWVPYHQIEHYVPLARTATQKQLLRPPYVAQPTPNWHNQRRTPTLK